MPSFDKDTVRLPILRPTSSVKPEEPIEQTQPEKAVTATNLLEIDLLGDVASPVAANPRQTAADLSSLEFTVAPEQAQIAPLTIEAYRDSCIAILMNCVKEDPAHAEVTTIYMSTSTQSPYPITNVKILPLAPKNLRVSLFPASETSLQASQPLTQVLKVTNLSHGTKPIALKLKIEYTLQASTYNFEQVVSHFPVSY
jgi:hypothetical protein